MQSTSVHALVVIAMLLANGIPNADAQTTCEVNTVGTIVEEGDLDIGEETLPGNLTLTRDTIFRMDGGGSINIKPNSSIAAATHSLTMVTNELNVDPTAGDITAENITITPQNKSLDIVLGTATGDGLGLGAAASQ